MPLKPPEPRGRKKAAVIAGYPVEELARMPALRRSPISCFTTGCLRPASCATTTGIGPSRRLPDATLELLRAAAARQVPAMDALRMAVASIDLEPSDDLANSLIAASLQSSPPLADAPGEEPVAPRPDLDHAANYLYMLTGSEPPPERARALETYLTPSATTG